MPHSKPTIHWTSVLADASRLWVDAGMVVALRSWRIMHGGPLAGLEFERMVSEKLDAVLELASAFAVGRPTSPEAAMRETLGVFGRRVRNNRRRLS